MKYTSHHTLSCILIAFTCAFLYYLPFLMITYALGWVVMTCADLAWKAKGGKKAAKATPPGGQKTALAGAQAAVRQGGSGRIRNLAAPGAARDLFSRIAK